MSVFPRYPIVAKLAVFARLLPSQTRSTTCDRDQSYARLTAPTKKPHASFIMKDCTFTLELPDGTSLRVAASTDSHHPDVKAFYFPAGAATPFSYKNPPRARHHDSHRERSAQVAF